MKRPTIPDLAVAAGVSRTTINRFIARPQEVRAATRNRIVSAAHEIGYYGLPALTQKAEQVVAIRTVTCLFQQPNKWFCDQLAAGLRKARDESPELETTRLKVHYLADFSPELVADQLNIAARKSDAIIVVAAEHPVVIEAIEKVSESGTPVFALISTLSAPSLAGFVGLDSRKVGRTAAWALHRFCAAPVEIGILLGSPRYRSHEIAESGFRSYFRDHEIKVRLLEPLSTFESDGIAREMTERLLTENPEMGGLFLAGGGTNGVIAALRDVAPQRKVAAVAYDLTSGSRTALLDGVFDLIISHPFAEIGRRILAICGKQQALRLMQGRVIDYVDFEMHHAENV